MISDQPHVPISFIHGVDRTIKSVTNSSAVAHKSWMVGCSSSRSGILVEDINTKILTKNHPDSPHSHPDSPHSHHHSPHSQPDSPHSHPDSLHSHIDFPRSYPDSPRSHHSPHSVPRSPIPALTDSH